MSDITSGYNIAENIYLNPAFNDLCGFHENEIEKALKTISAECGLEEKGASDALDIMRAYYIGYMFAPNVKEPVYDGVFAAEQLYTKGDMDPLCEFVEQRFFKVFRNRDYRWANELTVKTAFLTLLYNDILYIMDSEKKAGTGYADLTMMIRPDMRRFKILDVLVEFKFVRSLKEAGLTGKEARGLSMEELRAIPAMQAKMKEAEKQVKQYGDALVQKYGDLRLNRYGVVSLGFERLLWHGW